MVPKLRSVTAVMFAGAVTFAACGGGGSGSSPTNVEAGLKEYEVTPNPVEFKAGKMLLKADNLGSVKHEVVIVRAPSAEALPRVTTATADRAVGDVNEEAIPESDKIGETGEIAAGKTKSGTFTLKAGTYVMFCNIDEHAPDGTIINHFQHGMHEVVTVS